jgi:hypothetical protein
MPFAKPRLHFLMSRGNSTDKLEKVGTVLHHARAYSDQEDRAQKSCVPSSHATARTPVNKARLGRGR